MKLNTKWLYNPIDNFIFIFLIPLLSIPLLFVSLDLVKIIFGYLFPLVTILFAGGHNWGPLIYFFTHPSERARILILNQHLPLFLVISFCVPIVVMIVSIYFYAIGDQKLKVSMFCVIGLFYMEWISFLPAAIWLAYNF